MIRGMALNPYYVQNAGKACLSSVHIRVEHSMVARSGQNAGGLNLGKMSTVVSRGNEHCSGQVRFGR